MISNTQRKRLIGLAKQYLNSRDLPSKQKAYDLFAKVCSNGGFHFNSAWEYSIMKAEKSISCNMNGQSKEL